MMNGTGDGKTWNVMQALVGGFVVVGLFGVIAAWMIMAVTADAAKLDPALMANLQQLTGVVATLAVAVVSYYFGSSKSSADKEDTAKMATKSAVDAASATSAALEKTSATLDKVVSGTGNGMPLPMGNRPLNATIDGDVTLTPTKEPPTKEQLVEAAGKKFASGEYDEARFRATLQSKEIDLTAADIDAAVERHKPGGG